ncbi:MAG TPA: urea carboxylase-associated family protein [Stellaceae bacterium]|nr:urea carboxylase-associated family protein [Stellaceae bacterium]
MAEPALITIPARKGAAAFVERGQRIRLINTHGQQVVDTWAFSRADPSEFMSMEHSRVQMGTIFPRKGNTLVTNRRRAILTIVDDTSGGIHDTLLAACDRYRYELLGCKEYHDNCTDNLAAALDALGMGKQATPAPLNMFMNIPVAPDGAVSFEPPVSTPGSHAVFRAEMDLVIAFSACPQDLTPVNGRNQKPTEAHFQILG